MVPTTNLPHTGPPAYTTNIHLRAPWRVFHRHTLLATDLQRIPSPYTARHMSATVVLCTVVRLLPPHTPPQRRASVVIILFHYSWKSKLYTHHTCHMQHHILSWRTIKKNFSVETYYIFTPNLGVPNIIGIENDEKISFVMCMWHNKVQRKFS